MTGSQIIIESLLKENVDHIFGYAGATICPIIDVLKDEPSIGYTLVRTEQNAGHMASGYARVTGKPGVCLVTSGPGATNLLTGIATAHIDSIPMVAITGQVPSALLGRDIFQEVDITGAVSAFSKHSYLVKDAADLPRIIKEAFHIASTGRPGPVLIDIPIDVQRQEVENPVFPETAEIRGYNPSTKGNEKQINNVIDALKKSVQPVICAGGGVFLANAEKELLAFAEAVGAPVVTTMMGLSLLPSDHPQYMGMIGSFGNKAANKALVKADCLIMLGTRAADRAIMAPGEIHRRMPSIHIDIDPAEIGKNIRSEIPLVGDVKVILNQLIDKVPHIDCEEWLDTLREIRELDQTALPAANEGYVTPTKLMRSIGRKVSKDAAVCVDVGQNQVWACKHLYQNGARFMTSGGLGTMGYALPCAVGVKAAQNDRQTLAICGDGSFQMEMNELAAVAFMNYDIKIIMLHNGVLGLVNQIQVAAPYHGAFGVALDGSPDYAKIAEAYGIPCLDLCDDADIDSALDKLLAHPGPCMLRVRVSPNISVND